MRFVYDKQDMRSQTQSEKTCWLLVNGLGGYASTSAAFSVTRNDQGLLIAAKTTNQRFNLVHRLSEELTMGTRSAFLSSQTFGDETPDEDGWRHLSSFVWEYGPKWIYQVNDVQITRQCGMEHGANTTAVVYTVDNLSKVPCTLKVAPVFQFSQKGTPPQKWQPLQFIDGAIVGAGLTLYVKTDGRLSAFPQTCETLFYTDDQKDGRIETGLGFLCFSTELTVPRGETKRLELVFSTEQSFKTGMETLCGSEERQCALLERSGFKTPIARELARNADAFIADRASTVGKTIVAGYPFLTGAGTR